MTTHLRKLEDEFGFNLFDRVRRPIQPTSEGVTLLELVTPVVTAIDSLKTQMNFSERRGSFVVGAYSDLVMGHLSKGVQAFRESYPDVRIRMVARPYSQLIQMVKSNKLDLALCSPPRADDSSLEYQEVFDYNVVLMTPLGHPLLEQHPIELQEIARWPLILSGPESFTRLRVEQALKEQGISYDIFLDIGETEYIKHYAEIGMGVAVCADISLRPEDHDRLGIVRLDHLFSGSTIGVCTLKRKFLGRAGRNLIDAMVDSLRDHHTEAWD